MPREKLTVADLTQKNIDAIAGMERSAHLQRTLGERVADAFASSVGSWSFIIVQSVILTSWIVVNVTVPTRGQWDPYPFILMNLILSFQAAYASPIIMMSQNRQAKLSERRHHLDLQINLLAEQETTEILHLLRKLCEHHKLPVEDQPELRGLEQHTEPSRVVEQIDSAEKHVTKEKGDGGKPE